MPSFGIVQSYQELIEIFPEEAIYYKYLGHCNLNKHFISIIPIRIAEKGQAESTPSMMLKYKNGSIRWYDYGLPDQKGNTIVHLVMYLKDITNYYQAIEIIYNDMLSGDVFVPQISKSKLPLTKQIKYLLKLKPCQIEYYKQYGISEATLNKFNVYYAIELLMNGKLWHKSTPEDFMNLYLFNADTHCWHINRPYADIISGQIDKSKKHRPNNMEDVIMGYSQLPKYSPVIAITKAYKDIMLLDECGFPSVCKYGEWMIFDDFIINVLKKRCDHLIYIGDNDSTGNRVMTIYKDKYNLPVWSTPIEKDPSDFVKANNADKTPLIELLNNLKNSLYAKL